MKRMLTPIVLWFLASVVLSLSITVEAEVIYVKPGGNDNNTGLSWDQAKVTVQAGLNTAIANDQVWVAAGTYNERITLKTGVALYGGFAGLDNETLSQRNWTVNSTILDGQQGGSVVTSPAGADNSTRIDGFTIRNGTGTYSGYWDCGGGIYCDNCSSPTISNNTISGNSAYGYGGGIYCDNNSSPTISNNTISGNGAPWGGGGILCVYSSPTISNNTISGNDAGSGGGILCGSSTTISNNTISGNSATYGGGILGGSSSTTISNNTISGNSAIYYGGGIVCDSSPTISNNTISGNSANWFGGGIYCKFYSSPIIANNIIAFNGTGIYKDSGSGTPVLRNNCVFNPGGDNYTNLPPGQGDISLDPLFVDRLAGNHHLTSGSPCINAGNDTDVQPGWLDMDGQPRIYGPHVDIGADEYYPPGTVHGTVVLGDYRGDGDPAGPVAVNVRVALRQGNNLVLAVQKTLDGNGQFTIDNVTPGTYDVAVKAYAHLQKVLSGVPVSETATNLGTFELLNGDLDGNNAVDSTDLSIVLDNME